MIWTWHKIWFPKIGDVACHFDWADWKLMWDKYSQWKGPIAYHWWQHNQECRCQNCHDIAFVLKIVVTLPLFGKLVFQPQTSVSPFFVSANKRTEARHKPLKCPQTGFSGYRGFLKVVERTRRTCQVPTCASLTLASSFSICTLLPIFTLSELPFQKCHFTEPSWTSCSRWSRLRVAGFLFELGPVFWEATAGSSPSRAKWPSCGQHVAPSKDDWTTASAKQQCSELLPVFKE